mmetsp:Transcript_22530/g.46437  ORF Transcript_22530/g.46437 Transcript_22530/m.46437 type:complete len:649 (-) Transcript_22530:475-2421(-)
MLLPLVHLQTRRNPLRQQRLVHLPRLIRGHHPILLPLQYQHRTRQFLHVLDRRPLPIQLLLLRIPPHQSVEVPRFELVRVPRQGRQIPDPIRRRPRPKDVPKRQRPQDGKPPRAPSVDARPLRVGQTPLRQKRGSGADVVDVRDSPAASESSSVVLPVAGGAGVIDVQDGEAAGGPELDGGVVGGGGAGGGSSVGFDEEGGGGFGGAAVSVVFWGVVVPEGGKAAGGGEFDAGGGGEEGVGEGDFGGGAEDFGGRGRGGVPSINGRGGGRPGAEEVEGAMRAGDDVGDGAGKALVGVVADDVDGGFVGVADVGDEEDGAAVAGVVRHESSVVGEEAESLLPQRPAGRGAPEVGVDGQDGRGAGSPGAVEVVVAGLVGEVVQHAGVGVVERLDDGGVSVVSGDESVVARFGVVLPVLVRQRPHPQLGGIPRHVGMVPRHVRQFRLLRIQSRIGIEIIPRGHHRHRSVRHPQRHDFVHHVFRGSGPAALLGIDQVIFSNAIHGRTVSGQHSIGVAIAISLHGHGNADPATTIVVDDQTTHPLPRKLRIKNLRLLPPQNDGPPSVFVDAGSDVGLGGGDVHRAGAVRGRTATAEDGAPPLVGTAFQPVHGVVVVASGGKDGQTAQSDGAGRDGLGGDGGGPGAVGFVVERR